MTESSKYSIHTEVNQIIETNTGTVIGKGIQHNYASEQNLAEAAKEIQQLLDQLAETYPITTETEKSIAIKQIEQQPEMKGRVVSALEKGSKKALEKLVDHPAMAIAIAVYEGWKEGKKQ